MSRRSKYDRTGLYNIPQMTELIVRYVDANSKNPSEDFQKVAEEIWGNAQKIMLEGKKKKVGILQRIVDESVESFLYSLVYCVWADEKILPVIDEVWKSNKGTSMQKATAVRMKLMENKVRFPYHFRLNEKYQHTNVDDVMLDIHKMLINHLPVKEDMI